MLGDSSVLGSTISGDAAATAAVAAPEGGGGDVGGGGAGSNSGEDTFRGGGGGDDLLGSGERSFGGNRWPRQETPALLQIRSDMDVAFRDASVKGPLWEEVSSEKEGLDDVAAAKTEKLNAELEKPGDFNPVQRIVDGFIHFRINKFEKYPDYFNELAEGQSPKFLVFACSDSRVSPSHILNFQPGEAFMVRNLANMVPAFNQLKYVGVGATIEYAITELGVENILVIGHSRCGGITRLMTHPEDGSVPFDFIDEWVKIGLPAKAKVIANGQGGHDIEEQIEACARESVNLSLVNLQSYPYVQKAISNRNLALRGGYYDFVHGVFELWELESHISPPIIIPAP